MIVKPKLLEGIVGRNMDIKSDSVENSRQSCIKAPTMLLKTGGKPIPVLKWHKT